MPVLCVGVCCSTEVAAQRNLYLYNDSNDSVAVSPAAGFWSDNDNDKKDSLFSLQSMTENER